MEITHINNSFFEIKNIKTSIVFDPWIGKMDYAGTTSYPNKSNNKSILNNINPDLIYISHLHTDHYDENILNRFKNKNTPILIKLFKDQRLKNKIFKLGYKKIIELKEWNTYRFKNFELTIIPCDQSNSQGLSHNINYDLDTSILVYDKLSNSCFYNNVDNPLSFKLLKKLKKFAISKYKKIDLAAIGPRAASEYPQCFLNINRINEKKKIIDKVLKKTLNMAKILGVKHLIPAGGSYQIFGKYGPIQKFVAHPTKLKINSFFKKKINIIDIDYNGTAEVKNNTIKIIRKKNKPHIDLNKNIKDKYFYEKKFLPSEKIIKNDFEIAKLNYFKTLSKFKIKTKFEINFYLFDNIFLNYKNKIDKNCKPSLKLKLSNSIKAKYKLDCFLDKKLFFNLINNQFNWNMCMGGSLIFFKRYPNIFKPDISFSINFLKV
jgi:hypothetical protein